MSVVEGRLHTKETVFNARECLPKASDDELIAWAEQIGLNSLYVKNFRNKDLPQFFEKRVEVLKELMGVLDKGTSQGKALEDLLIRRFVLSKS
jgi:hypothetical protein